MNDKVAIRRGVARLIFRRCAELPGELKRVMAVVACAEGADA